MDISGLDITKNNLNDNPNLQLLQASLVNLPLKKTILFHSSYFEVLKVYVPFIESLSIKHKIFVFSSCLPFGSDEEKCKDLLKVKNIQGVVVKSSNPVDVEQIGKRTKLNPLQMVLFLFKEKKAARKLIKEVKPDVIIVGADTREFEKYLIEEGHRKRIPSICFHWSLGPITVRAFEENKKELLIKDSLKNSTKNDFFLKKLFQVPIKIIGRLLKLNTPIYSKCFGGGNASILTAIGNGSKEFFSSMNIDKGKIRVIGHPLFENIYYNKFNNYVDENFFDLIGIKKNSNFMLYCTGYLKPGYYKYITKEKLFLEREKKVKALLNSSNDHYIIIKSHPREDTNEFQSLSDISDRVKIISDIDSNDLILKCDLLLTRASTTATYAIMHKKPVITHDYPALPMGSLYNELGGTIHVENEMELINNVINILNNEKELMSEIFSRQKYFLKEQINLREQYNYDKIKLLPSIKNFTNLLNEIM